VGLNPYFAQLNEKTKKTPRRKPGLFLKWILWYNNQEGCDIMAKFRYHRGGLRESMETIIEVSGKQDLVDKFLKDEWISLYNPTLDTVQVKPYSYDDRIKWDTHIVTLTEWGVVGFTDGPLD